MKKIIIFLLAISLLSACRQNNSKSIIDKETYKNILKELILVNLVKQEVIQQDSLKKNLLQLVYQKYHIDSLKFKKTTDYYSKHPEQLTKIYDEIYLEIKKVSDSLENITPKKEPKTDKIKIPKNVLKKKPYMPKKGH